MKPRCSALWADPLPSKPPGKLWSSHRPTQTQGKRNRTLLWMWGVARYIVEEYVGWKVLSSLENLMCYNVVVIVGNGNPLQCSCLENPRDGGAWWAAVYGVTQSQTRLKRLSSSSSSSSDSSVKNTIIDCYMYWHLIFWRALEGNIFIVFFQIKISLWKEIFIHLSDIHSRRIWICTRTVWFQVPTWNTCYQP